MRLINRRPDYRADIDGLRAIAVLAVAFFHAGISCPGGFVGVDVFFVISGYLITKLILNQWQYGKFSVLDFWNRRIRRILPILFVVLIVTIVLGYILLWPSDLVQLAESVKSMSLMLSNIYFWQDTGYFAESANFKQLLHTWSLSIEEQFYVLYPLLLIAVMSRFKKKSSWLILALLIIGSLVISITGIYFYPRAAFYLLPARAWELLAGGLLAAQNFSKPRFLWLAESCSLLGLAAILLSAFWLNHSTPFPGFAALLPVTGTVMVIYGNSHYSTFVKRLLSWPALVFVGLISYSFYLWHWPLLLFGRIIFWGEPWIEIAVLGSSLVISMFTWKWVEQPFRKRSWSNRRVYWSAFTVGSLLVLLSTFVIYMEGFPGRAPSFQLLNRDSTFEIGDRDLFAGDLVNMGWQSQQTGGMTDIMVIGDSHAAAVLPAIHELAVEYKLRGISLVRAGRSPFGDFNQSSNIHQAILQAIEKTKPRTVILVARWTTLFGIDSKTPKYQENLQALSDLLDVCLEIDAKVLIMGQVPWHNIPRPVVRFQQIRAKQKPGKHLPPQIKQNEYIRGNRIIQLALQSLTDEGIQMLDLSPYCFDQKGLIRYPESQHLLYWDDNHFTQFGAKLLLSPLFRKVFTDMNN